MKNELTIESGIESVTGHCDSCGHESRLFRGYVYNQGQAYGVYLGAYTQSHPELGVSMAISLRGWGGSVDDNIKECIALEWRTGETGLGVAVIEAPYSLWSTEQQTLGHMLTRQEAISSGRAQEAFAVTDIVWISDPRLAAALANNNLQRK